MASQKFKIVPTIICCFSGIRSIKYKKQIDLVPTQAMPKTNIIAIVSSTLREKFMTTIAHVYIIIVPRKLILRP